MLSTNDLRVCELLGEGGWWTRTDIDARLRRTGSGSAPALERLNGLRERGLIEERSVFHKGTSVGVSTGRAVQDEFALAPEGLTEVRRAHTTAYGRAA